MPRNSGLFGFVNKELRLSNYPKIKGTKTINQDSADKTPAVLVFLKNLRPETVVFADLGYTWLETKYYQPHLRCDAVFHSSKSPIQYRRNLSYSHATEYYSRGTQLLVLHYYFDQWCNFTHHLYHFEAIDSEEENSDPRISESTCCDGIYERAQEYSKLLKDLRNDKQQLYADLTTKIQAKYISITGAFVKSGSDLSKVTESIEEVKRLVEQRDNLEDNAKDSSIYLFLSTLKTLERQAQQSRVDDQDDPEVQEQQPRLESLVEKKSPNDKRAERAKAEKSKIEAQLVTCKAAMKKLNETAKIIRERQDSPASNVCSIYVRDFYAIREQLFFLGSNNKLTKQQEQELEKLWKQHLQLPSEISLFEAAVSAANLDRVKELFPYCSELIKFSFYFNKIQDWIELAKNVATQKKADAMEKVFDFLSDNCGTFNNFIEKSSRIYTCSSRTERLSYNILCFSYVFECKKPFAALLRYGFDPFEGWIIEKEFSFSAMQVITQIPSNTDFYVKTLLEYGIKFAGTTPTLNFGVIDAPVYLPSKPATALAKRRSDSVHKEVQELAANLGVKDPIIGDQPAHVRKTKGDFYPMIELVINSSSFFLYPNLFKALSEHSDPVANLVAFSRFVNEVSLVNAFVFNAPFNGLVIIPKSQVDAYGATLLRGARAFFHVFFVLSHDSPETHESAHFLLQEVKAFFNAASDTDKVKTTMDNTAKKLFLEGQYEYASLFYMATILYYCFRNQELSYAESEECANLFYRIARANELNVERGAKVNLAGIRVNIKPKLSESQARQNAYAYICKCYTGVLACAASDSSGKIKGLPIAEASKNKLLQILNGNYLDANMKMQYAEQYKYYSERLFAEKSTRAPKLTRS